MQIKVFKSKTFWTGAAAVASAGVGYASGELTTGAALQTGFMGLIAIFLRGAIEKAGIK